MVISKRGWSERLKYLSTLEMKELIILIEETIKNREEFYG